MKRFAKIRALLIILALFVLTACVTATGYQKIGSDAFFPFYGYETKRIGNGEFSIYARGNPQTHYERVAAIAFLRAANVAREEGKEGFIVIKSLVDISVNPTSVMMPIWPGIIIPVGTRLSREPYSIFIIRPADANPSNKNFVLAKDVIDYFAPAFAKK